MSQCRNCSKDFTLSSAEKEFCKKMEVPEPTLCKDCCMQRLMTYRNERIFYSTQCHKCHKQMVSIYSPEKPYIVYCQECWWNDNFNPLVFGRDFDFSRPFFEQFSELMKSTPLVNLVIHQNNNSDFTNYVVSNSNCYLIFASDYNEGCFYSGYIFKCRDCFDCFFSNNCENSYQLVDCDNCYGSQHLQSCKQCLDCQYGYYCRDCTSCFACAGLHNQQYCILNKKYSEAEYKAKVQELLANSELFKAKWQELKLVMIHKFTSSVKSENCTGDYLNQCQNCHDCYDLIQAVDCSNCRLGLKGKDSMNSIGIPNSELVYESVGIPEDYQIKFCALVWPTSSFMEYCFFSRASQYCFGCVATNKNKYCILNKQYSEDEYWKLRAKIIESMKQAGEWGEFFPIAMSPFCYNETAAQDYYPLTEEQILSKDWKYREPEKPKGGVGDDILVCQSCSRPFRIIKQEKDFYREHQIELPRQCFNCRHLERLARRNPKKLWHRKCMNVGCKNEFETTYAPDRPEKIYCEICYQKEIY